MEPTTATAQLPGQVWRRIVIVAALTDRPGDAAAHRDHHPSLSVLLVPSRPCWSWSMTMSVRQVGHLSPPVAPGLVAIWSQFQADVARLGVWRPIAFLTTLNPEHQIQVWCSIPRRTRTQLRTARHALVNCARSSPHRTFNRPGQQSVAPT
jgi:hypothetical protein